MPPLWYVHALMGFMLLAGIIHYVFSRWVRTLALRRMVQGLVFLGVSGPLSYFCGGVWCGTVTSPFYFAFGMMVSGRMFMRVDGGLCVSFVGASVLRIMWFMAAPTGAVEMVVRYLSVVCQIIFVWTAAQMCLRCACMRAWFDHPPRWFTLTFFVYVVHGPLLEIVKWCLYPIVRNGVLSDCAFLVLSVVAPITLFWGAWNFERCHPQLTALLSGGR